MFGGPNRREQIRVERTIAKVLWDWIIDGNRLDQRASQTCGDWARPPRRARIPVPMMPLDRGDPSSASQNAASVTSLWYWTEVRLPKNDVPRWLP